MDRERVSARLEPDLRRHVAEIARDEGTSPGEVIRTAVREFVLRKVRRSKKRESAYAAFKRLGLIGCCNGPSDLSTNPKYMRGFGGD